MDWILHNIKAIRNAKGLSQQVIAQRIGIDLRTYSNWERGVIELNLTNINKIATALEIDVKEIWDENKWVSKPFDRVKELAKADEPSVIGVIPEQCKKFVDILRNEVATLKEQNIALTRAYNDLFDKHKTKAYSR